MGSESAVPFAYKTELLLQILFLWNKIIGMKNIIGNILGG